MSYKGTADTAYVAPLDEERRQQVIVETESCLALAERLFEQKFARIPVMFDLKGRAAGMYVVSGKGHNSVRRIRYNPWLFAKYFDDNLRGTVPHEVAHYVTEQLYGLGGRHRRIRPHGREWQSVMAAFGADASVTARFDMEGIPRRRQQTFCYGCNCRQHRLGIRRHNKVLRGEARYHCRFCGDQLVVVNG